MDDPSPWGAAAAVVAAYLLGSVSFAWILVKKLKGIDLRTVGSGNLGATNAGRVLGRRLAIVIYLLDFLKGLVPVLVVRLCLGEPVLAGAVPVALLAGLAAFLGHCFPVWHGFRGGKGVATASGVIAGLTPLVALAAFATFAAAVRVSRTISAGSIAAAVVMPVAQIIVREGPRPGATAWLYAVIGAVVIARHRKNLKRLLAGEEPKIGKTRP